MWVAPNFVPPPDSMATYKPEGVIYAFEFVRGPSLWKHMLLKPTWSFNYSAWVAHQLAIDAFQQSTGTYAQRWKGDLLETRNSHMGMWPLPLPPETHCVRPDPITGMRDHSQNAANEADFLRRYAVDGTRVIVDISPAADCDQNRFQYIQLTQGLTDNTLEFLPIENFNEGDIHYSPAGSKLISEQAADQLLSIIRQDSHQSPSDPSDLDQTSPRRSPAR